MAMNPSDAFILEPVGAHTQNASLSSAATITVPSGAGKIVVQAITQNIRMTLDGTAPTTTKGFRITAGNDPIAVPIGGATVLRFIEEIATATLEYQFSQ